MPFFHSWTSKKQGLLYQLYWFLDVYSTKTYTLLKNLLNIFTGTCSILELKRLTPYQLKLKNSVPSLLITLFPAILKLKSKTILIFEDCEFSFYGMWTGIFQFTCYGNRNFPGIPLYGEKFQIVPFPKLNYFPEEWKPYLLRK